MRACVFTVGDAAYALDVRAVREVAILEELTRVPLAPRHVLGAANLRGEVVAVVDPGTLLGAEDRPRGRKLRALVVATEAGDAALVVDEVIGLDTIEDLSAIPVALDGTTSEWTIGRERRDGRPVTVLDARAVVAALRPGAGSDQ